ncbi:MAG: YkgJ family cysteine cluster protein [Saprospiraceae bacterium]
MDLPKLKIEAVKRYSENKKFLTKLKAKAPKDLDGTIQDLHEAAFSHIDCLECANCCKTTSPIFLPKDIERIAKHLRMRAAEFIKHYLHLDEDNDYVHNGAPCPFLGSDNYCSIYEVRPKACEGYPHTDRKKAAQLFSKTLENTKICPAVFEIVEQLKKIY